jgi:hypothetical protein
MFHVFLLKVGFMGMSYLTIREVGIPGTIACNVSEISIIYYVYITKIID